MKLIVLVVLALLAVANCHICENQDPSKCTHSCPDGEAKACEHDVCTCAPSCTLMSDCAQCPSHSDPSGHEMIEHAHCIDGACVCLPEHMGPHPGGDHHGGAPGGR